MNVISTAVSFCEKYCGTTEKTPWYVTFVTGEVKRGLLVPLDGDFYALQQDALLYIFDSSQVVHISPHLMPEPLGR